MVITAISSSMSKFAFTQRRDRFPFDTTPTLITSRSAITKNTIGLESHKEFLGFLTILARSKSKQVRTIINFPVC